MTYTVPYLRGSSPEQLVQVEAMQAASLSSPAPLRVVKALMYSVRVALGTRARPTRPADPDTSFQVARVSWVSLKAKVGVAGITSVVALVPEGVLQPTGGGGVDSPAYKPRKPCVITLLRGRSKRKGKREAESSSEG